MQRRMNLVSKGQKVITHHTLSVITTHQASQQYNLSGKEWTKARGMLEALAYIRPIRQGSHTYELLKGDIPETFELLEKEFLVRFHSYVLTQAYQDTLADLLDLI